jgi:hypothetical protein
MSTAAAWDVALSTVTQCAVEQAVARTAMKATRIIGGDNDHTRLARR